MPSSSSLADYAIVGGGIVGLAVAARVQARWPRARIVVLEKETDWARHQTGRNSGVIHSGLYYKPGSLKARLCVAGARSMVEFCTVNDIPHRVTGKVVVATEPDELPRLEALAERGAENGVPVRRLIADEVREYEPHVKCLAGLHVATTGVTDYAAVARVLAGKVADAGGDLRTGTEVTGIRRAAGAVQILATTSGDVAARTVVGCAGLHADRLARMSGLEPAARIVPFRGEYYELRPAARHLAAGLVYPVPDPAFPFLGVHLTRMIDGSVHVGPNAVLAFAREGYRSRDVDPRHLAATLGYSGTRRLARRHWDEGAREMWRSVSRRAFVRRLQRLVPAVTEADLVPADAGVRAQAVSPDGALVDDFLIVRGEAAVHVLNAPSPAATSSLQIANVVVEQLPPPHQDPQVPISGMRGSS